MKTLFLDLQLFDGAEGAPAEGATAETGVEARPPLAIRESLNQNRHQKNALQNLRN